MTLGILQAAASHPPSGGDIFALLEVDGLHRAAVTRLVVSTRKRTVDPWLCTEGVSKDGASLPIPFRDSGALAGCYLHLGTRHWGGWGGE